MFKLFVFFTLLAVAFAAPGFLAASPLAYSAYSVPAPYAYTSGYGLSYHVEPVEQHGWRVAY